MFDSYEKVFISHCLQFDEVTYNPKCKEPY